ncbi:hypothetical protein [Sphingorhabdus sp.]|uniref:DUF7662 domain-containing protein n=1 Tax=Sphingorhabdus sp. TaxID=1902408 RepID=UPI0035B1F46F
MSRHSLMVDAVKRGKYSKLFEYLIARQGDEWSTNFQELEALLGFALPNSARIYRPWWANDNRNGHSQSMAWTVAGWKTTAVDLNNETLTFRKVKDMDVTAPAKPISDTSNRSVAPKMDDFREELKAHLMWGKLQQMSSVVIKAGDLHRSVGGYPTPFNRMTMCCNAMYQEQRGEDRVIERPNKGYGATLTIEYQLPRG